MPAKTEAQLRTFDKTREHLHSLFGEVNVKQIDDMLVLQEGSTFVYVRVLPIGDTRSGVEVFAYVVIDVEPSEDLMRYLLTYNLKLVLGGFGLVLGEDGRGTILLTHTILGDTMDREELYGSVSAIARVADDMDDLIVKAFGGERALDRLIARQPIEDWE